MTNTSLVERAEPYLFAGGMQPPWHLQLGLDAHALTDVATRLPARKGVTIGRREGADQRLYLVLRGQVLLRDARDGHAMELLGPGDLFGEAAVARGSAAPSQAIAVADGEVLAFPAALVPMLSQRFPQFASCLLGLISARLAAADRRLRVAAIDSAPERLLALLHALAEHLGEPCGEEIWLPLQLTQTELADLACLVRETVVRSLAHLEAEGEIRREGRRGLWLRQRGRRPG